MAIQKKHGKGRLDKYYWLAKEKGYRARASFKLIQLNKKYHFLEKSKVLIDLCAAPGSWCQVAAEVMPANSMIIGVDLSPIKSIPRCFTFQSDITTDKCRSTIRQQLKSWKADTVLHDGAPNVGTAWVQDAFSQAELVLQSLRLATDFLIEGGTFVTKVFRSKDSTKLEYVFRRLFKQVEHTKPPASRTVSAEIFYVCRGYLAPKKIDPRLLDPRSVFEELADPTPNNEAKVFNPEKKKRKRDGYEEGDYTQFKEAPASQFIQTTDPIAMLGSLNKLSFEQPANGDLALATLEKLPETTEEIRNCCRDLKVLGRKDFRSLLRWRMRVREIFGFSSKKKKQEAAAAAAAAKEGEEVAEIESMDEEMKIQMELERLKSKEDSKQRKERRKDNETKRKTIVRMQLGMTTPMEIGMEQDGPMGEDSMFALKAVDKANALGQIARGRMQATSQVEDSESSDDDEEELLSDEDGDNLERQLDSMYEQYQERKAAQDTNFKAKKARKQHRDEEWEGIASDGEEEEEEEGGSKPYIDNDSDSSDDEAEAPKSLLTDLGTGGKTETGLTRRAAMFFDQDIFSGIEGLEDEDSGIDVDEGTPQVIEETIKATVTAEVEEESDSDFEIVADAPADNSDDDWDEHKSHPSTMKTNGRPDIDIITAEAMTLAHQLASGEKTRADLVDDGFNRYSLRDVDGLPEWFLDDENQHSKMQRPRTAEAAAAIKEKIRALNARPIKKVREAKERKKFKAARRLEKMRKKSALLLEDDGMSEADKAKAVQQMMAKAARKKPRKQVTLVVARGGNRGISGRPKGTKGRYKMVDARLKKDMRAEKRLGKKR